jgi:hypothetical protein
MIDGQAIVTAADARFGNHGEGWNWTYGGYGTLAESIGNGFAIGIDCTHFVYQSLLAAGYDVPYYTSEYRAAGVPDFADVLKEGGDQYFSVVTTPQAGDIIVFPGHAGIVVSYNSSTNVVTFANSEDDGIKLTAQVNISTGERFGGLAPIGFLEVNSSAYNQTACWLPNVLKNKCYRFFTVLYFLIGTLGSFFRYAPYHMLTPCLRRLQSRQPVMERLLF